MVFLSFRCIAALVIFLICRGSLHAQGEPPWRRPLKICRSADGTSFGNIQTFQDSSGVPCLLKLPSGVLVSAFQWFRQPVGSITWDRVAVKFSSDNGLTWTSPQPVTVNGLPQNFQRPFDPTLANTDDGRIRLYFSSGLTMFADTSVNTYSAVSYDGVNYTMDEGVRFGMPDKPVIDPAVIRFRGLWHLANPITAGTGAYHNISQDGVNFTRVQDIPSDQTHSWIGNYMIADTNELRFYGSGSGIWFSSSPNGGVWSSFTPVNVQGGDPAVIRLSAEDYIMIYTGPAYPNSIHEETLESAGFELYQNYPNPFNPSTKIKFSTTAGTGRISGSARLLVSDIHGKTVFEFEKRIQNGYSGEFEFQAGSFPSGVYFYHVEIGGWRSATKKMVLQK
ncbi:MAG: hypothetical protein K1X85_01985 [Ignavibacteria bacterium]|nr:hypothetical protein [Ignavibacteria bacterium]